MKDTTTRRRIRTAATAMCLWAWSPMAANAQNGGAEAARSRMAAAPTIKVLASSLVTAGPSGGDDVQRILQAEVRETVRLYLSGKIDQWYTRKDRQGVVFVMNVTSVDEARALLDRLPLGRSNLMSFEYIPLGPLMPLSLLANEAAPGGR